MSTLGRRIFDLRKEKGLSRDALGAKVGVSKTAIKNWEDDENVPKHEYLDKMAQIFNCTIDYLVDGKKEELNSNLPDNIVLIGKKSKYPLVRVEYLDIKASCGIGYNNADYPSIYPEYLSVEFLRENDLPTDGVGVVVMHACNDSMGYTIPDGSIIVVDTNDKAYDNFVNKKVYIFKTDGEFICKRAVKNLDGTITLKSDNVDKETYPDQLVTRDTFNQFELYGRVHWVSNKV